MDSPHYAAKIRHRGSRACRPRCVRAGRHCAIRFRHAASGGRWRVTLSSIILSSA